MNLKQNVNDKSKQRGHSGFTLVELLVTVSIIAVLLALILAGLWRARVWSKERGFVVSLGYLHNAVLRYNQTIPFPLSHKDCTLYTVTIGGTNRPLTSMEYFILRTSELPQCAEQLEKISNQYLVPVVPDSQNQPTKFDIYVAATGAIYKSQFPLRTVIDFNGIEAKFCGSAASTDPVTVPPLDAELPYWDFPYFAGAGKDAKWGSLTNHDVAQPNEDAKDNIYSFNEHQ